MTSRRLFLQSLTALGVVGALAPKELLAAAEIEAVPVEVLVNVHTVSKIFQTLLDYWKQQFGQYPAVGSVDWNFIRCYTDIIDENIRTINAMCETHQFKVATSASLDRIVSLNSICRKKYFEAGHPDTTGPFVDLNGNLYWQESDDSLRRRQSAQVQQQG